MKRKFSVGIVCIFTITTLLFAGCSNRGTRANNLKEVSSTHQTSNVSTKYNTSTMGGNTTINKDAKDITDSDLINSEAEDTSIQLDSLDTQAYQLSTDEIDSLLNDNSDLQNIPSNFSVKQK